MTNRMHALTFSRFGAADVLEYVEVPRPEPADGSVLVRMMAIGLNYADIYRRRGNYHLVGEPPYIAGYEGAGVVVESLSARHAVGDRVAFADVPRANAEFVAVPEAHVIPLADDTPLELAAAVLLQGLTAHYLASDSHRVQAGESVVVHAAAGGVGQILVQVARMKGATVIGLSRDPGKLALIRDCGADHAVALAEGWPDRVREFTGGVGADVVYDSVGATLGDSFAATRDRGHVVFYGMSGGDPAPVDPRMLMDTSKTLSGGDLWSYLTSGDERRRRASELLGWIADGHVRIREPVAFPLAAGREAHLFLEGGGSAGKVLLIP